MQEAHFGYVDYEMNPKPSYHAVKNLLAILHDETTEGFHPQSLQYSLEGPTKTIENADRLRLELGAEAAILQISMR